MKDLAAAFERFHADNPIVYDTLVRLARQWVETTGRRKLGIANLYERARWEIAMSTGDPEYKLNNDYKAFYARLIMASEAKLGGLFSLRTSAADQWIGPYMQRRAAFAGLAVLGA